MHLDQLAPAEHVSAGCLDSAREQHIQVLDGIVYVVHGENETVLTPGDSITIHAGDPRRIWNAGDETARVAFTAGSDAACAERATALSLAA